MITQNEAARRIGCSPSTIAKLIRSGKLRAFRFGTGRNATLRIIEDDLAKIINQHQVPALAPLSAPDLCGMAAIADHTVIQSTPESKIKRAVVVHDELSDVLEST